MIYTQHSPDNELISGCVKQDRLAQKYLYQRYYGKMLGIAMRFSSNRDEANDILNRGFLKVFDKIEKYEPTGSFSGWIAKIVWRTALDFIRSQAKYKNEIDIDSVYDIGIESTVIDNLIAEDLFKIIQELPPATRAVFSLYVIDGYKHQEIATLLDISEGTSKWHLSDGKKRLRQLLTACPEISGDASLDEKRKTNALLNEKP
jgi:RNA polymerase sigma-70 factor (ECF subfamily)